MCEQEGDEDRREGDDRFLDPPQIDPDEKEKDEDDEHELVGEPRRRKEAEDGVRPRRDRDRDRQDVVDDERRTRDHPRSLPEELRRDDVPAAAGGERLDDLRVAPRDDEDGEHGGRRDEEGQDGVPPEGEVRLFRAVRGGGDPVRPQPHPGEEGDQGDVVEDLRVEEIPGSAEQDPLDPPVTEIRFPSVSSSFRKGSSGPPDGRIIQRFRRQGHPGRTSGTAGRAGCAAPLSGR